MINNEDRKEMRECSDKYTKSTYNKLVEIAMKFGMTVEKAHKYVKAKHPKIFLHSLYEANNENPEDHPDVDTYKEYAKTKFSQLVSAEMQKDPKLSHGQAISKVAHDHPEVHADMINQANGFRYPGDIVDQAKGTPLEAAAKSLIAKDFTLTMKEATLEVGKSIVQKGQFSWQTQDHHDPDYWDNYEVKLDKLKKENHGLDHKQACAILDAKQA